jgi:hypothetical protein
VKEVFLVPFIIVEDLGRVDADVADDEERVFLDEKPVEDAVRRDSLGGVRSVRRDGGPAELGQDLFLLVLGQGDAPLAGRREEDHVIDEAVEEPAQGFGRKPFGLRARRLEISPQVGVVELVLLDAQDRAAPELALDEPGDAGDGPPAFVAAAGRSGQEGERPKGRRGQGPARLPPSAVRSLVAAHLF